PGAGSAGTRGHYKLCLLPALTPWCTILWSERRATARRAQPEAAAQLPERRPMSKQLIKIVLPQPAPRLHRHVPRYPSGKLTDAHSAEKFEASLRSQSAWLADRGVKPAPAAVAVHGAVLVLTGPGLRAEAEEQGLPLEVVEYKAIRAAAVDIAKTHGASE